MKPIMHWMFFAVLILSGCNAGVHSWLDAKSQPATTLQAVSIVALPAANQNTATAVDLVFAYDAKSIPLLPKNAADWFAQRDSLRAGLGAEMDIVSVEVPPAYVLKSLVLPGRHHNAVTVIAFANYLSRAGNAAINLSGFNHAELVLDVDSVRVSEAR